MARPRKQRVRKTPAPPPPPPEPQAPTPATPDSPPVVVAESGDGGASFTGEGRAAELAEVAEHIEREDGGLVDAPLPPDQPPALVPEAFDAETFARGVAGAVFEIVAMRRGAHWKLKAPEADALAAAFAPLARRLSGTVNPLYLEIGTAAGAVFAVVMAKVQQEQQPGGPALVES